MNPKEVYAPHGFELLYQGIWAMNPLTPLKTLFDQKAASYLQRWPWLIRVN